jgi:hypothetical protein
VCWRWRLLKSGGVYRLLRSPRRHTLVRFVTEICLSQFFTQEIPNPRFFLSCRQFRIRLGANSPPVQEMTQFMQDLAVEAKQVCQRPSKCVRTVSGLFFRIVNQRVADTSLTPFLPSHECVDHALWGVDILTPFLPSPTS